MSIYRALLALIGAACTLGAVYAQVPVAGPEYAVGADPSSLARGRFHGNGCVDLIVANRGSSSLSVLPCAGAGAFGAAQTFSLSPFTEPTRVGVGDFNSDGADDVAVVCAPPGLGGPHGVLAVYRALGNGTFDAQTTFTTSGSYPEMKSVAVGDINNDGKDDVAYVGSTIGGSSNSLGIQILLGTGTGTFTTGWYSSDGVARRIALADVNGDGEIDVLVTEFAGGGFSVFVQTAGGMFVASGGAFVNLGMESLAVGDIDGNGVPDVATGSVAYVGSPITVFTGTGSAPFFVLASALSNWVSGPQGLAIVDINHDGKADIVAANGIPSTAPSVIAYIGKGGASFADVPSAVSWTSQATSLVAYDINADGSQDIAATFAGSNTVGTFLGEWLVPGPPAGTLPYGIGTAGCAGTQVLEANVPPAIGTCEFALRCTKAPPGGVGLWILTDAQDVTGSDPFFVGATLHVDLLAASAIYTFNATANAGGVGLASIPIPNVPARIGLKVYAQAVWAWPILTCFNVPYGLSTSNGLAITLLP